MSIEIISPQEFFYDKDGTPLDSGYIYIGKSGQNPETTPIPVYWDASLTQPAPQPIRTMNGFIARQGSASKIYASSPFSITVKNKRNELVLTSRYGVANGLNYAVLQFPDYESASNAAVNLQNGQTIVAPDASGELFQYTVSNGALSGKVIDRPKKTLRSFGAIGDGIAIDDLAIFTAIAASAGKFAIDGEGLVYKCSSAVDFLPFSDFSNLTLDLTNLASGAGVTHRVGSRFVANKYIYNSSFSGTGVLFRTIDNGSSTSVSNLDTNRYICEDLIVEKQMPTTGIAWDWYTNASGVAIDWFGEDNPDPIITSGFWGGWLRGANIKGVWLQSGLVRDDGTGWITSSSWSHVVMDGPRRGIQVNGAKTGNMNFDDLHMQGWRWTKSGQPDVITEWMIDVPNAAYCKFSGVQPQDFDGAFGITEYIRLGAGSRDCYVQSNYITTDSWLQNLGTRNYWYTNFGMSFNNIRLSSHPRTLDYFQKYGSFTPALNCSDMSYTYAIQSGFFTRIGNIVNFHIQISVSSQTGSGLNVVNITGLPFLSLSSTGYASSLSISYYSNISVPAGRRMAAYIGTSGVTITLQHVAESSSPVPMSGAQLSGSRFIMSGSYLTN